jgi:hypothetical protein
MDAVTKSIRILHQLQSGKSRRLIGFVIRVIDGCGEMLLNHLIQSLASSSIYLH